MFEHIVDYMNKKLKCNPLIQYYKNINALHSNEGF